MLSQLFALILGALQMKFLLKHEYKNILSSVTSHYPNNFHMTWTSNVLNEKYTIEFRVWSQVRQALYCLPCRMFWHNTGVVPSRSALASPGGWTSSTKWRNLSATVREYEEKKSHEEYYTAWRELEGRLLSDEWVDSLLEGSYQSEAVKWCNVLKRIIDVILFRDGQGLAFGGSSHLICDPNNGNILGLIELLSRLNPLLKKHVQNVREYQENCERLQVHYLSPKSKNEFIFACSNLVKQHM